MAEFLKARQLRDDATQCRRLADGVTESKAARSLPALADKYEREAEELLRHAERPPWCDLEPAARDARGPRRHRSPLLYQ